MKRFRFAQIDLIALIPQGHQLDYFSYIRFFSSLFRSFNKQQFSHLHGTHIHVMMQEQEVPVLVTGNP